MSTSGAYGFQIHGQDKVTFNQFDSYPEGLGKNVMYYIALTPLQKMKKTASNITLVSGKDHPSSKFIKKYQKLPGATYSSWNELLLPYKGDLFCYYFEGLEHMVDDHDFLADSLLAK